MTFIKSDLHVTITPDFVEDVDRAMQSTSAELLVFHALTLRYGLVALNDYLRKRADELAQQGTRQVLIVGKATSESEFDAALDDCVPGTLVLLAELDSRPQEQYQGQRSHSIAAAAWFIEKGATVIATVHGSDAASASKRCLLLWQAAIEQRLVGHDDAMPSFSVSPFKGVAREVPILV